HTPSAALGSCRYKLQEGDPERAVEIFRRYNVRYVLYIGGNDSADTAHRLSQTAQQVGYDLSTISVPKTIDNDLPFTDHCPGYGIVVAAEKIRDEKGQALGSIGQVGADAFNHPLLSGVAQYLVELVMRQMKVRARFDKPGDLQRMASHCVSSTDRDEAYLVGQM